MSNLAKWPQQAKAVGHLSIALIQAVATAVEALRLLFHVHFLPFFWITLDCAGINALLSVLSMSFRKVTGEAGALSQGTNNWPLSAICARMIIDRTPEELI